MVPTLDGPTIRQAERGGDVSKKHQPAGGGENSTTGPWVPTVEVSGQKVIEADPRIVDAFKNIGYSLEAAVADLVDNSIDAGATEILIRFLRTTDENLSLVVIDNGRGMSEAEIDRAMQFGGRR